MCCFRIMPSLFPSHIFKRGAPETPGEVQPVAETEPPTVLDIVATSPAPIKDVTDLQDLTTPIETTGGEPFEKHIFGNKKFHPSHGRTTPHPEAGIVVCCMLSLLFEVMAQQHTTTQHCTLG